MICGYTLIQLYCTMMDLHHELIISGDLSLRCFLRDLTGQAEFLDSANSVI